MKEFEKIESLLKTKAYNELSKEEQLLVDQELTKEAYDELRSGMYLLKDEKLPVSNDVKKSLMAEFKQIETKGFAAILSKKVPAYTVIAPIMILIAIFWFLPTKEVPVIQDRLVEVTIRDTIQVVKTDTLWREKIVKIPQLVYVAKGDEVEKNSSPTVTNRSLGEQKELLDLVVKGK